MKKILSLLLGAGLLCTLTPVSSVQANNTDDAVVSSQQEEKKFSVRIEGVTPENGVYLIENPKFRFELNFPKKVDIKQLAVDLEVVESSEPHDYSTIGFQNNEFITEEQYTDHALVEGEVHFEGNTTVEFIVKNKENSDILFSDTISIKVDLGELVVSKNEFNLSTNQLAISDVFGNPNLTDVKEDFLIGFKRKDGTILNINDTRIAIENNLENSNPLVAIYGDLILNWDDERLLPILSKWEHYEEFVPFYWEKAKESNSKYTSFHEFSDIIQEFQKLHGYEGNGIGITGDSYMSGIIARNPGTAYITLSAGDEIVKIKVNVSNLSEQPINNIPNNFVGEYYSDTNTSVNVNLSQPNVISKDIFNASKATGKNSTFNILNAEGNLDYSWTFEGSKINRTDLDVNLSIAKNDKYVSDIKTKTKLNDVLALNFAHNGELPAPAKIRVYVGDTFKNGEQLYLNYWDNSKKSSSEVANSLIVEDGYVEFTINHCSTYFLTKEKVSDKENVVVDEPQNNDKSQTNTDKPVQDNANKTDVPNTGVNDNARLYLILSVASLMLVGCVILKKRLQEQNK